MKKGLITVVAGCLLGIANAQDIHFSQTNQVPLLINPGAAGVMNGWERVIINHRNQWLGANTQFMTTNVAADFNLLKSPRNDRAHLGLGVLFYNDVGGDANFGHRKGALTVSGILPMGGSGHILSLGIQGGFGNRSGNVSALRFNNQWDGTQFNSLYSSGEENKLIGFNYLDASAGLFYCFDGSESTFQRNREMRIQFGLAGFHLNAPEMKFSNGSTERMARKYTAFAGVLSEIGNSKMSWDATGMFSMQGKHMETLLGIMLRYRFEDGTKITGNSQDAFFAFGCYGRINDAIIPSVMIDWNGFQLGISYDVTLSAMRKAYGGGSLEFSLSYVNRNHALFKNRRSRF